MNDAQLRSLADEYGTPLYVYDADTISRQWQKLQDAFSGHPTRFFYACKALSNIHVLRHLHGLVPGWIV